jgi:GNAT superfamily N-acetyltransferase
MSYTVTGYYPGALGAVTETHARYYSQAWGFDRTFEIEVAGELAEFLASFEERRNGLWVVRDGTRFGGSIAVQEDREDPGTARLRWFIVDTPVRGRGFGSGLLARAMTFCTRQRFRRVYLWTFEGLTRARELYESAGFRLAESRIHDRWGQRIEEQRFELSG